MYATDLRGEPRPTLAWTSPHCRVCLWLWAKGFDSDTDKAGPHLDRQVQLGACCYGDRQNAGTSILGHEVSMRLAIYMAQEPPDQSLQQARLNHFKTVWDISKNVIAEDYMGATPLLIFSFRSTASWLQFCSNSRLKVTFDSWGLPVPLRSSYKCRRASTRASSVSCFSSCFHRLQGFRAKTGQRQDLGACLDCHHQRIVVGGISNYAQT